MTVSADGFGYGADFEVDPGADALVSYSEFLASAVEDYDVFHFYFRSFFFFEPANNALFRTRPADAWTRQDGRNALPRVRGSGGGTVSRSFAPQLCRREPLGHFHEIREPSLSSRIDYVRSVANVVLVPDEELQSYVPGSRIVRRAIDLQTSRCRPTPRTRFRWSFTRRVGE